MQNQINQIPVTQFIQQVRSADQSQSKEVKMSIQQARALVLVLAEMQSKLLQDYETMFNQLKQSSSSEVITITMDGGNLEE
jgi:hypothetical protein